MPYLRSPSARIAALQHALDRLLEGGKCSLVDLFGADYNSSRWHYEIAERLTRAGLLVRHRGSSPKSPLRYEAIDKDLVSRVNNEIVIAKLIATPKHTVSIINEAAGFSASAAGIDAAAAVDAGIDAAAVPYEKLLGTTILLAENVVYLRSRVEYLCARLDALCDGFGLKSQQ